MSNIIVSPTSGVIEFNTGSASGASFYTSTAPIRLDATGGNSWLTGTNVGIGTNDPTAQYDRTLHIEGANPTVRLETNYSAGWAYNQYVSPQTTWSVGIVTDDKYTIANSATLNSNVRLVIDDSNGFVGIGTDSPLYKLDVSGTIAGTSGNFVSGITIGGNPVVTGTSAEDSDTLQTVTDRGNTTITGVTIGSSRSPYTDADGNGGERKLFVDDGDLSIEGGKYIALDHSYRVHGYLRYNEGLSERKFEHYGYYGHTLSTRSKSNALVIRGDVPRIGFGESDPMSELHLYSHGVSGAAIMTIQNGATDEGSWGGIQFINSSVDTPRSAIFSQRTGGAYNADLTFHATIANEIAGAAYPAASERMRIKSDGKVGIGTNDPDELLHVDGKTQLGTNGFTEGGAIINYASLSETKGGASTLLGNAVYAGATNNTFRKTKGDAGNYITLNYNKGITFHTNVTGNTSDDYDINTHEQMRLTTGGYLGIGTNAPAFTLDARSADNTLAYFKSSTNKASIYIADNDSAGYVSAENGYMSIGPHGGLNTGNININLSDGSVGIGTVSPSAKLDIWGAPNTNQVFLRDSSDGDYTHNFWVDSAGHGHISMYQEGNQLKTVISTAGHSYFNGGRVGIGTATPEGTLAVFSANNTETDPDDADNYQLHLHNPADDNDESIGMAFGVSSAGDVVGAAICHERRGASSWGDLYFSTRPDGGSVTERLRIGSNGKVGIGTSTPASTLDVHGTVMVQNTGGDAWLRLSSDGSNDKWGFSPEWSSNVNTLSLYDYTKGGLAMEWEENGNINLLPNGGVGIGTQSPNATLDVRGDISGSGNFYGTGVGSRITNNGTPYLLSGDAAAALTLQDVTDNGATTTNALKSQLISITGGGYSSPVGVNGLHLMFDGTGNAYINAQHNGTSNRHLSLNAASYNFNIGDLAVNTDTLYVDVSEDRVGIGIASPKTLLDVDGAANHGIRIGTNNALIGEGGATGTQLLFWNGTSAYYGRSAAPFTHTVSNHFFRVGSSDKMMVGSAGVGIGTVSPAYPLDVQAAAAEIAQIKRTNGGNCEFLINPVGGDAKVVFQNSGTDIWAIGKDNSDSSFRISEGGALETNPRFTVDNGGNVGIGTTSPDKTLHVESSAGSVKITSTAGGPNLYLEGAAGNLSRVRWNSASGNFAIRDDSTASDRLMVTSDGDIVSIDNKKFKGTTYTSSYIKFSDDTTVSANSDIIFDVNGSTELMRLEEGGNVGIGTDTPLALLDVAGGHAEGTAEWQDLAVGSAAAGWIDTNDGIGRIDFYGRSVGGLKVGASIAALADANWNGSVPWGRLEFKTANGATAATRMTLNSDGELGIGTPNPVESLQVSGNVLISGDPIGNAELMIDGATSSESLIRFKDAGAESWILRQTNSNNYLSFRRSSTDHVVISNGGYVGIGVAAPAGDKLMVQGAADYFASRLIGAASAGQSHGLRIRAGYNSTDRPLLVETWGGTDIFKIDGLGDVSGAANFYGTGVGSRITNNGTPYLLSGDAAAALTLQNVTDNGNTTTTSIISSGPHISGATGLFGVAVISDFNSPDYAAFGHEDAADNSFAIRQHSNSNTYINCGSSRNIEFRQANSTQGGFTALSDFFVGPQDTNNTLFVDVSETSVGINTYAPGAELDLRGDMRLDGSATDRSIYFRNQDSVAKVRSDRALQFDVGVSASPSMAMYIEEDTRHVGIITTNPVTELHVAGQGNATISGTGTATSAADLYIYGSGNTYGLLVERQRNDATIVSRSTTAGAWFLTDSATSSYQGYQIGDNWFMGQYGYNDFRIVDGTRSAGDSAAALTIQNTTKYVGIGTTTPATELEVYGVNPTIRISDSTDPVGDGTTIGKLQFYGSDGSSAGADVRTSIETISENAAGNAYRLAFLTSEGNASPTEKVTIKSDGNVGIGTDTPSYELDVVGTTRSTYYIGGAYFEENASDSKIKFYPNGTVLVLDEDGSLKPCEKENDSFVFGVSKRDFDQPIVLGAEPVLVTGPIKVGDYIVTSDKQGHGQASKEPKVGNAIAQAMENGDGESYNIKAMIRKM